MQYFPGHQPFAEGLDDPAADEEEMRGRMDGADSPPERPNWGFGPSRAQSRMDEYGYLNGYESDEQEDNRSPSRNSHYYR